MHCHLHVINTLGTLSMLHFSPLSPLNEDPSSILAILTKNDSREICINTWYLLWVSTECTTMSQPLSCSSRQLWLLSHTGALLSCPTAGLLLFTFTLQVFCDVLCSDFLHTEENPCHRSDIRAWPPYQRWRYGATKTFGNTLCFTILLLSCLCSTRYYPVQEL